jgi:hypothetical protein
MNQEENIPNTMGDFVTLLVREISQSISLARYDAPLIQVQKVRVRFGEEEGSDSVIVNRYPFMANGWDVEMDLGGILQARLYGEALPLMSSRQSLLDIFGDHPVWDIKGVNTDWASFFHHHKIETIGRLAAISAEEFQVLAKERRSINLWEIHGKARLLKCEIPFFPSTSLDTQSLYTILKMSPDALLKGAGSHETSMAEIQRLADILEILAIVVDYKVLQAKRLEELLAP